MEKKLKIIVMIFTICLAITIIFLYYEVINKPTLSRESVYLEGDRYCESYDGVNTRFKLEESLSGITVFCNQVVGERCFLFWCWDIYESVTIEKDGDILQDRVVKYLNWIVPISVVFYIVIGIMEKKEKHGVGE